MGLLSSARLGVRREGDMAAHLLTFAQTGMSTRALQHGGDRHRIPWARFGLLADMLIPRVHALHRYSTGRYCVMHPK